LKFKVFINFPLRSHELSSAMTQQAVLDLNTYKSRGLLDPLLFHEAPIIHKNEEFESVFGPITILDILGRQMSLYCQRWTKMFSLKQVSWCNCSLYQVPGCLSVLQSYRFDWTSKTKKDRQLLSSRPLNTGQPPLIRQIIPILSKISLV
jgi:hypothetical protein